MSASIRTIGVGKQFNQLSQKLALTDVIQASAALKTDENGAVLIDYITALENEVSNLQLVLARSIRKSKNRKKALKDLNRTVLTQSYQIERLQGMVVVLGDALNTAVPTVEGPDFPEKTTPTPEWLLRFGGGPR